MDFTRHELYLISEGLIQLIKRASAARSLVSYDEAQKLINVHIEELQELNSKVCRYAENASDF